MTKSTPQPLPQTPIFTIRPATLADAVGIANMGASIFASTFDHSLPPEDLTAYLNSAYSPASIAADLADPAKATLVAVRRSTHPSRAAQANELLGFALLTQGTLEPCVADADRPVELQRLYVSAAHHGSGIGKALEGALEEIARQRGFRTLWLGVWEENVKAQRAYERMGFEKAGDHDFVMGSCVQTDWIMSKLL